MLLTIILTSYNRPRLIRRTLVSLIQQTDPRWECLVLDDGSNQETLDVLAPFVNDKRFQMMTFRTTPEERAATARYATLLNMVQVSNGIVGYLCDNVEYKPRLVSRVNSFFLTNPNAFSGYVLQYRDIWARENDGEGPDGERRIAHSVETNMIPILPRIQAEQIPAGKIKMELDHSQVFHRAPIDLKWDESLEAKACGDGIFFEQMAEKYGPIRAISPGEILTYEHTLPKLTVHGV